MKNTRGTWSSQGQSNNRNGSNSLETRMKCGVAIIGMKRNEIKCKGKESKKRKSKETQSLEYGDRNGKFVKELSVKMQIN